MAASARIAPRLASRWRQPLLSSSALRPRLLSTEPQPQPLPFRREAVFLAGLPGSGKTRIIEARFGLLRESGMSREPGTTILDLDREMVDHPEFLPDAPHLVYDVEGAYEWADNRVESRFHECVRDASISRIVLDGTGTKVPRRTQRMLDAKRHGLWVTLRVSRAIEPTIGRLSLTARVNAAVCDAVYVRVKPETALRRNARRDRVVPVETMLHYARQLEAAVELERPFADTVTVIDNDVDEP